MSDVAVALERSHQLEDGQLLLNVDGMPHFFDMRVDRLSTTLAANIADRLLDLLDIAGTAFAADSAISRGGLTRKGFGADWRRHIHFQIPVRAPDFWNSSKVTRALISAVEFLTDDTIEFTLVPVNSRPRIPSFLNFGAADAFAADEVVLFSGGLDSLAGAMDVLATTKAKLVLVTHRSAQVTMSHQDRLVEALKVRFPGRILWVPVIARRSGSPAAETTQRTRSLLFAAIAFLVAEILGAKRISFFENGVVSHNLPISPQVIGTLATRTTHPLSLLKLGSLLGLVAGRDITINNPYAWLTKAEVIGRLVEHGGGELVKESVSCSHVRGQTVRHPHCGACSQCIDRRMAVMACGADHFDPAEMYATEVFTGEREKDTSRTMALDWTRHSHALPTMSDVEFVRRYGNELGRICEGFPDRLPWEAARDTIALQRRHGENVRKALEAAVCRYSAAIVDRSLPDRSLLRMFLDEHGSMPAIPEIEAPPIASEEANSQLQDEGSIFPLKVMLDVAGASPRLTVRNLGTVTGAPVAVVEALKQPHDEDRLSALTPENFRFSHVASVAGAIGTTKDVVDQRVQRCRRTLAEYYEAIEGTKPCTPLLIHTRRQKGYRLDPDARFVDQSSVSTAAS